MNNVDHEAILRNLIGGVEVCQYDAALTLLYVNEGFLTLIGYTQEEVFALGTHEAMMLPEDIHQMNESIKEQLRHGSSFSVEYRMVRKDGNIIWVLDQGICVDREDGEKSVQCGITDITDRKEQEQLLMQKSFELQTLTDNIQAAIIRCEFHDLFPVTYANNGLFSMLGFTRMQFEAECGNLLGARVHPDDWNSMMKNLNHQLKRGNTTSNTARFLRRDGSIRWILAKGTIVTDASGGREFHGILSDVTTQKDREESLQISERRYEIAMNFSDIDIFDYHILTKQLILSESDAARYHVPRLLKDAVEAPIKSGFIHHASVQAYRDLFEKINRGALSAEAIIYVRPPNSTERIFKISLTNLFDCAGNPSIAIGVKRDITETLMLQREKEYGNTMVSNQLLTYEANINRDKIIAYNNDWAEQFHVQGISSYSQLISFLCDHFVDPAQQLLFSEAMSPERLIDSYDRNERQLTLEYRKKINDSDYRWFRKNVSIIKDATTNDISIRCYIVDINDRKEREIRLADEQKYYEKMVAKSIAVYVLNLSKDQILSGHEQWEQLFGISLTNHYTDMINEMGEKAIYPKDKVLFLKQFSRDNLLHIYKKGMREQVNEYRRPNGGAFIWVRNTMHLFEEPQTGEIKAFVYVEDIHTSKTKSLEILYKSEHDLLTGFYNKDAVEKHIQDFLSSEEGKLGKHAFWFIDIDCFKAVNDHFGHAFGDEVLSTAAEQIRKSFRKMDILGRVGGDEFVVLMKNMQNEEIVCEKAKEMGERLLREHVKNDLSLTVSISMGIAFYKEHGETYRDLYVHADAALYQSKGNGRNCFSVYRTD